MIDCEDLAVGFQAGAQEMGRRTVYIPYSTLNIRKLDSGSASAILHSSLFVRSSNLLSLHPLYNIKARFLSFGFASLASLLYHR